ncbi:ABC transporter ATP-binding protein [Plectonema cf. radiosum LEGE 06105]|uniref:ABC transporter ATP-binding protein n=1 Tax=Plectonema cf. radiosum LEGE 06105 TaxID=945769 RepID=A0A8J7K889_9CYAN|nr:ABC transporter ATP-binding protein [Plectonema radiosum]MBE9216822.1 ABC transporter ATP-binding protein [Plectonema cf. radiosum LEGE 06105]
MNIPLKFYSSLLKKYLLPQRSRVIWLTLTLLSTIALQLINPQIMSYFIDTAVAGGSTQKLDIAAFVFIAVALLTQLFFICAKYLGENVAWTATNALRSDLVTHCLYLNFSFYKSRTPGEIIERVDGDVNALSRFFSQFIIDIIGNIILLLGILIVLFLQNWLAGTCLSIFSAIALTTLISLRPLAIIPWTNYRQVSAEFFGFIGEYIAGLEDIQANGAVNYVMYRFHQFQQRWQSTYYKARLAATTLWGTTVGLFTLGNALALGIAAYLWNQQAITIGTAYILFYYTNLLQEPIEKIREQLEDFQQAEASIYRIQELLQIPQGINHHISGNVLNDGALSIEFENVHFNYDLNNKDSNQWVLNDVSFNLAPNQVLGILGRTGSGKTTITRLLLRFYQPQLGNIRFNNIPIGQISTKELQARIGVVTQDVQLFQATVRDNLTFFNSAISDEQILDVLDGLGLTKWLYSLPHKLDTYLTSESGGLSAGQAQLLAFTRVFLKNPSLVILDEASSRLDSKIEQYLEVAIDKLLTGRTVIIIAHRLQTLQRVNQILMLDNGRTIEYGSYQDLINNTSSHFSQLLTKIY